MNFKTIFEDIDKEGLENTLHFIDSYWDKIIHPAKDSHGDPHAIALPKPYIVPHEARTTNWNGAIFYWDTFFISRGLIQTKRSWIIKDMIENFTYLFKRFGVIPNASRWAFLNRSQPPFLSSMIFDYYYTLKNSKMLLKKITAEQWLKKNITVAKEEYWGVWEDINYYHHKVPDYSLSRYGDRDVGYGLTSELESGWDLTTRYYDRCNDFLPVDLNAYLHKYEKDFAKAANLLKNKSDEAFWEERATKRHQNIKKHMWNEKEGFFFDYDYRNKLQSEFYSLAGFVPMWTKLATYTEAKRMVEKLSLFETEYGLTITAKKSLPPKMKFDHLPTAFRHSIERMMLPKQWDYPHIWAPIEYLTIIGLLRYGFIEDAVRIMKKSIKANINIFKKNGALFEKIDAVTGENPATFWYPSQLGFGWTNAIFYRYVKILEFIQKKQGDIYSGQTETHEPPYSLTEIIH
jgi:alpha,alpha-trehalase